MRDKLNLLNTQKTLIHAFFDGFMNGVTDANELKPNERQTLIKTLLNVYEKVSEHYAVVMLPILGVVHHETLEQLQCKLDALRQQGDADVTAFFKVVCGEEGTYEAMVDDYKANFEALLKGTTLHPQHLTLADDTPTTCYTKTNEEQNIRLLVRTILRAYSCGLQTKPSSQQFKQATVIRMVLDNVDLLVNGKYTIAQHMDKATDIHRLFLAVVHTQERYNVVQDELQIEMERLIKGDN
ncbi:MAG: hypothetical protein D8H98_16260 [Prevotella sp.]|nr:MAG: hypothetical protein D8H98_16260 [Prevotella sp.]